MLDKCLSNEWTHSHNNHPQFWSEEEGKLAWIFITKVLCLCWIFWFKMLSAAVFFLFKDVTYCARDTLLSPTPGTFFVLKHITYLLCYANESTARGAKLCERQKERAPINTKNLDQRAFYYKLCSFLKDSKHDEFLFATEFMKMDGFLCGCFNRVCLAVWGWAANPHRHIHCHP